MKKLLAVFLLTFSFASKLSIINPNWSILDSLNNFHLVEKKKYEEYLKIIKETDKVISIKSEVNPGVYKNVFKSGLWDELISYLEKIYNKEHNKTLQQIINYMKDIKRKVKERSIAIV